MFTFHGKNLSSRLEKARRPLLGLLQSYDSRRKYLIGCVVWQKMAKISGKFHKFLKRSEIGADC